MQAKWFVVLSLATVYSLLAGCGADSPQNSSPAKSASAEPAACTLLTAAEIEEAMGVVPGEPENANPGLNNCQWPNPGSPFPVAYVGLSYHGEHSWEKYREGMIASDMGDPEAEGERIDIGRFGHYHPDTSLIQVFADGGLLITLNVRGATKAQILDLANRALARLD